MRAIPDARWQIIDGHHRTRAVREIAETADIQAVVIEGNEDPRLVALALNRLRGETDLSVASRILAELVEDGLTVGEMNISGFSERELADLIGSLDIDEPDLSDIADAELPEEVGAPVIKPFLLELTFRSREDLLVARKALRKACGKGGDMADGLLRLVQG